MKFYSLIFWLLIFCLTSFAQFKNDLARLELQGSVQMVHTKIYFESNTGKKGIQSDSTERFDQQGNLTERQSAFGLGTTRKSIFSTDKNGNRIEKISLDSGNGGAGSFPAPPRPAGSDDVLEFKTTVKFDPASNQLESVQYRKNGELLTTTIYKFDASGRVVEKSQKDGPTIPFGSQYKIRYERDNKGTVTKSITYKANGKIERQTSYTYVFDKQGNWIKREELLSDEKGKPASEKFISLRTITYY